MDSGAEEWRTYSLEVDGGCICAIVVVAVDVEDFLALHGQDAGEDTLGQAGACEVATR